MTTKKKNETLQEFVGRTTPLTWAIVPLDTISKKEFQELRGENIISRMVENMNSSSNRDLVIEAVALLDNVLSALIKQVVVASSAERLFGRDGKIQDIGMKTEIAFALGLISAEDRTICKILQNIRNRFAHDPNLHAFEHDSKVIGWTQSLPYRTTDTHAQISLRTRFSFAAIFILSNIDNYAATPGR